MKVVPVLSPCDVYWNSTLWMTPLIGGKSSLSLCRRQRRTFWT